MRFPSSTHWLSLSRSNTGRRLLLVAAGLLAFGVTANAQRCSFPNYEIKIKLAHTVSSATARESDYVEFVTLQDIYSADTSPGCRAAPLIPKGTSVFGTVTKRKHRHFPLTNGWLEVQLEDLRLWNGDKLKLSIARHSAPPAVKDPPKPCKNNAANCLAGRKNSGVAPVVASLATAGSGVVTAVAGDSTTRVIAASALFTLLSQTGVGELLNGTDAQLDADEVFDMTIVASQTMDLPPKAPDPKKL